MLYYVKDNIGASVDFAIRRGSAQWSLAVLDDSFESIVAWTGSVDSVAGVTRRSFIEDDVQKIRERGKFAAFMLENGANSPLSPETISQWKAAIPGFTDIVDEIRQLRPGQTESVGRWQFTRLEL